MYPTLYDTNSGRRVVAEQFDSSLFWWSEGNGSCDCNRAIALGEDIYDELTAIFGDGCCFGAKRIVAVDVHGDLEGMTKADVLEEMNSSYPQEAVMLAMQAHNDLN